MGKQRSCYHCKVLGLIRGTIVPPIRWYNLWKNSCYSVGIFSIFSLSDWRHIVQFYRGKPVIVNKFVYKIASCYLKIDLITLRVVPYFNFMIN